MGYSAALSLTSLYMSQTWLSPIFLVLARVSGSMSLCFWNFLPPPFGFLHCVHLTLPLYKSAIGAHQVTHSACLCPSSLRAVCLSLGLFYLLCKVYLAVLVGISPSPSLGWGGLSACSSPSIPIPTPSTQQGTAPLTHPTVGRLGARTSLHTSRT